MDRNLIENRVVYESYDILYSFKDIPEVTENCVVLVLDPTFKDIVILNIDGLSVEDQKSLIWGYLSLSATAYKVSKKVGNTYFCELDK